MNSLHKLKINSELSGSGGGGNNDIEGTEVFVS
jgi:hypothetical protein